MLTIYCDDGNFSYSKKKLESYPNIKKLFQTHKVTNKVKVVGFTVEVTRKALDLLEIDDIEVLKENLGIDRELIELFSIFKDTGFHLLDPSLSKYYIDYDENDDAFFSKQGIFSLYLFPDELLKDEYQGINETYKIPTSLDEMYAEIRSHFPDPVWLEKQTDWITNLDPKDIELIMRYGSKKGIQILDKEKDSQTFKEFFPLNYKKGVGYEKQVDDLRNRLSQIINEAPAAENDFIVYRGYSEIEKFIVPDKLTRIASSSMHLFTTMSYLAMEEPEISSHLEIIKVVKGTKCLFISPLASDGMSEFEIIFPVGTKVEFVKKYTKEYTSSNFPGYKKSIPTTVTKYS